MTDLAVSSMIVDMNDDGYIIDAELDLLSVLKEANFDPMELNNIYCMCLLEKVDCYFVLKYLNEKVMHTTCAPPYRHCDSSMVLKSSASLCRYTLQNFILVFRSLDARAMPCVSEFE